MTDIARLLAIYGQWKFSFGKDAFYLRQVPFIHRLLSVAYSNFARKFTTTKMLMLKSSLTRKPSLINFDDDSDIKHCLQRLQLS